MELVKRADRAARAYDSRVFQVTATYADNLRHVLVATSDGVLNYDRQPLARLSVSVLARQGDAAPQSGHAGGGGRVELIFFSDVKTPEHFAREAARQAIVQLDAVEAPAGEKTVVLGPGWPGVLLHEAVGHGLEADFNRKKTSRRSAVASANRWRARCAPWLTMAPSAAAAARSTSMTKATPRSATCSSRTASCAVICRTSFRAASWAPLATGSGRRESYEHIPMPRMTNTFMLAGESDPEDIIRSVPKGLYCANFGGGQVDITSGNFVFSASESYLIEDGKLTRPVRNATLDRQRPGSA